jgi:hypothetical protein
MISLCVTPSHSNETLTYACTHTLRLRLLALYSASKTDNRKTPQTCLYQPHGDYCLRHGGLQDQSVGKGCFHCLTQSMWYEICKENITGEYVVCVMAAVANHGSET